MPYMQLVNDIWRVRVIVPPELVPIIGKANLTRTTKTGNQREANAIASQIVAEFLAKIDEADAMRNGFATITRALREEGEIVLARFDGMIAEARLLVAHADQIRAGAQAKIAAVKPENFMQAMTEAAPPAGEAAEVHHYLENIELWVLYRRSKGRHTDEEKKDRQTSKMRRLFEFLGHNNMKKVTEADLNRYVEESILAPDAKGNLLSASAVRDHVITIRAQFRLAYRKGRITTNPATGLEYQRNTGNERDPFEKADRLRIVAEARKSDDPLIRIGNLLGAHGMRVAEFAEARREDLVIEDGVPVFFVDTRNRNPDETLKTKTSKRWITLHEAVRAEVMAYRDSLPDGSHLFPSVPVYKGRRNKAASMRINNWLHHTMGIGLLPDGTADPRVSFHSWRHAAKTVLQANGVPDRLSDWITGHAGPANVAKRYLHPEIPEVEKAINSLPYLQVDAAEAAE